MITTRYAKLFKIFPALACLTLIAVAASACVTHGPRKSSESEPQENTSEVNPNGLNFEMVAFDWEYSGDKRMIKIFGTVRNDSGQDRQAVTLKAVAFDEKGNAFLSGRSFLTPTYLPQGAEAEFEYTTTIKPAMKNIKYIRLVTQAETLN